MSNQEEISKKPNLKILNVLPTELQRDVLIEYFSTVSLGCDYGPAIVGIDGHEDGYMKSFTVANRKGEHLVSDTLPIYCLNEEEVAVLNEVNALVPQEAHISWESYVTFVFPSTVAMMDVFLGPDFSPERRGLVRRVDVHASPLPLYPLNDQSCYTTLDFDDVLDFLDGLELDDLIVHDVYLDQDDGWGRGAFFGVVKRLVGKKGWRRLSVLAGDPRFSAQEVSELQLAAYKQHDPAQGSTCVLGLPTTPVLTDSKTGMITGLDMAKAQPKTRLEGSFVQSGKAWGDHMEVVTVTRGRKQDITVGSHDNVPSKMLTGLLIDSRLTWMTIRRKGSCLVDEGLDDPCGHC